MSCVLVGSRPQSVQPIVVWGSTHAKALSGGTWKGVGEETWKRLKQRELGNVRLLYRSDSVLTAATLQHFQAHIGF